MFRIGLRIAGLLATLPLALGGASAAIGDGATAETAWANASQRNTLEGYAEFVIDHPDSKYVQQAYARLSAVGSAKLDDQSILAFEGSPDLTISKPEFVPNSIMVV
jgi:hypothetical protein